MKNTLSHLRKVLIPIYGKGENEAIIRLIFHHLKGWNLTDMLIHGNDELSPYIKEKIEKILQRLVEHEPIQYIAGETRFHGLDLAIGPGVLVPRPETEELVDLIIEQNNSRKDLKVLDICAGSGCIALSLARALPFSEVTALDFSDKAMEFMAINNQKLKTGIKCIKADIFQWTPSEKYDIIVSNPPYVMDKEALNMDRNVLDYEPHEAIFVRDDDPLSYYRHICLLAKDCLKTTGSLYFEINPLTLAELMELMKEFDFKDIMTYRDSFGKQRFLSAKSPLY